MSPAIDCWTRHFPNYRLAAKNILQIIQEVKKINFLEPQIPMNDSKKGSVMGVLNSTLGRLWQP